jgi:hypothetical protein
MPIRRWLRPASTGAEDRPAHSHRKARVRYLYNDGPQARLTTAALRVMAKNNQKTRLGCAS